MEGWARAVRTDIMQTLLLNDDVNSRHLRFHSAANQSSPSKIRALKIALLCLGTLIISFAPLEARPQRAMIALTFDDGPYPVETGLLLDVLAELRVPATFFLIGHDTEMYPGLAKRIVADGHEIANHTQTHPARFDALSPSGVKSELDLGAATLERYVRDPAIRTMMRPPHGRFTEATVTAAQADGYHVILWNDDPGDWRSVDASAIDKHMEENATAPDIVLLHSGRLNTVEALPSIVARFRAAGFTFVTVGQLLARVPAREIVHPAKLRV